ncbi:MAG: 50S ribosomal protein L23 [Dehalococcoidales bacterium]|nr:50S ribosomal protein L23 [Dehalococcoidales bacterium]
MRLYEVIKRPLVTEKNARLQAQGKYAFEVNRGANKVEIKEAVEEAFKVTVTAVNIVSMPGKDKRIGRAQVTTSPWKKAVITLKAGDKIDLFENL